MRYSLFILLAFSCFGSTAQSDTLKKPHRTRLYLGPKQNEKYTFPNRFWIDVSLQAGISAQYFGNAAGGNLHFLGKNHRHYQVRFNYFQEIDLFSPPRCEISDAGYLFGWICARKYFMAEIALGAACVFGYTTVREPVYDRRQYFATIGIPLEADIKFMARRYVGLGLVLKANLNPTASYVTGGVEFTINGPN